MGPRPKGSQEITTRRNGVEVAEKGIGVSKQAAKAWVVRLSAVARPEIVLASQVAMTR